MTKPPLFPGFDGLMTLSRREGVDIRPTLLRVLTDLYVQASAHSGGFGGGGCWPVAAQTCLNGAKTFTDCFP